MNTVDETMELKIREFASRLAAAFLNRDLDYIASVCDKIRNGYDMYFENISSYPQPLIAPNPMRRDLFWITKIGGKNEWRVDTFFSLPSGENSDLDLRITIKERQTNLVADVEDILVP